MGRHKKNSPAKNPSKKDRNLVNSTFSPPRITLKTETKYGALAIICLVLAIFFLLASFNQAGSAGQFIYQLFDQLFGAGFYFIPLIFLFLAISFVRSMRPNFVLTRFIGGLILFLAVLSFLSLIFSPTSGGWLGNFLTQPLLALFDFYLSLVTLVAAGLVSLLVMFDTGLNLNPLNWFKKKELNPELEAELNAEEMARVPITNKNPEAENKTEDRGNNRPSEQNKAKREDDGFMSGIVSFGRRGTNAFTPPPLSLLETDSGKPGGGDIKANMNIIKRTLANFGINVEMDEVSIGPSITRYALKPAEGMKLSRILGLQNDLSMALAAHPLRIEAPIPGKSLVGIEVPNTIKSTVGLATLLGTREFAESPYPLYVALGKGISGAAHYTNLAKSPHLLIAGATGSGKSVTIHALITSLLYRNSPDQMRFIMIDPKRVELTLYNKIPHLLTPVITDAKKAIAALRWAAKEMDRRYDILEAESVRDIQSYHKNILATKLEQQKSKKKADGSDEEMEIEQMPYIVIIIDELADIMSSYPRELEAAIVRLAQMSRAVGIHLMLSTQRPSVEVITGLIKANIPSRLALQVASQIDSRTIIDMAGAEKLIGAGDMLFLSGEMAKPARIQSAFITENEVKKVVAFIANQYAGEFIPSEINFGAEEMGANKALFGTALDGGVEADDELYEAARESVIEAGKASASYLQRKLKVGYARAARLLDLLEEHGVIGPGDGAKPREIYTDRPSETVEPEEINPATSL